MNQYKESPMTNSTYLSESEADYLTKVLDITPISPQNGVNVKPPDEELENLLIEKEFNRTIDDSYGLHRSAIMDARIDDSCVSSSSFAPPDKSVLNHAQVDFKPFLPLKAKIDCIVYTCKESDRRKGQVKLIQEKMKGGHVVTTHARKYWYVRGRHWLAVHDPSSRDLQYLVERFWDMKILYIEFAVDAHLPPGSNDLYLLEYLKAQLRHCLYPQDYAHLSKAKRKYFNLGLKRYRTDGLGTPLPEAQIIWEQPDVYDQLGLYIKTKDQKKPVGQPWVRMEARLEFNGLHKAGLGRVGMLPHFAENLRTYLAPMFLVACGFKNADDLVKLRGVSSDPWKKWGAQWNANGVPRLEPDTDAKMRIGDALNELRRSLKRLTPPLAVAHRYGDWVEEILL
jgi:hypothetical protein